MLPKAPKQRYSIKTLLAQLEHERPNLFASLLNAMRPLMSAKDSTEDWS